MQSLYAATRGERAGAYRALCFSNCRMHPRLLPSNAVMGWNLVHCWQKRLVTLPSSTVSARRCSRQTRLRTLVYTSSPPSWAWHPGTRHVGLTSESLPSPPLVSSLPGTVTASRKMVSILQLWKEASQWTTRREWRLAFDRFYVPRYYYDKHLTTPYVGTYFRCLDRRG